MTDEKIALPSHRAKMGLVEELDELALADVADRHAPPGDLDRHSVVLPVDVGFHRFG